MMHSPPYDPHVPDRIDPWPIWCAAMHAYTARSERNLLTVLTMLPEEHKDTMRHILGQVQERLNAPPWDREEDVWP